MKHPVETSTANELLKGVVKFLEENGVADASLRALADALGVSTYKFVYHFGSKDKLIASAIDAAVQARVDEVRAWLEDGANPTVGSFMKRYWEWFCQPQNQTLARLLFEINGLTMRDPEAYPDVLRNYLMKGIELEKQILNRTGLTGDNAETLPTVVCTATWGMQLDLLNTGDSDRVTKAFHALADSIDDQVLRLQLVDD